MINKTCFTLLIISLFIIKSINGQDNCWGGYYSINKVKQFVETKQHLWVASDGGLLCLDKQSESVIKHFTSANSPLIRTDIDGVAKDKNGNIWAICKGQIVKIKKNKVIPQWDISEGLYGDSAYKMYPRQFFIDRENDIWVGTLYSGLLHLDGKKWEKYNVSKNSKENGITAIQQAEDGSVWVGTQKGLAKVEGDTLQFFPAQKEVYQTEIVDVIIDNNQQIWVADENRIFNFSTKKAYDFEYGVDHLLLGGQSQIYMQNGDGIRQFENEDWTLIAPSFITKPIENFWIDQAEKIWAFGERFKGLKIWDYNYWNPIDLPQLGGGSESVEDFLETESDFFIITRSNLFKRVSSDKFIPFSPLSKHSYAEELRAFGDTLLIHTYYHYSKKTLRVDIIDSETFTLKKSASVKMDKTSVRAVKVEGDSAWIICNNHIYAYDLQKNEISFIKPLLAPISRFHKIKFTEKNKIWGWSKDHLLHYNGKKWITFDGDNSPFSFPSSIRSFKIDRKGHIWVMYSFYIYKYANKKWEKVVHLPFNRIFCGDAFYLNIDKNDHIWLGRRGLLWKYDGIEWKNILHATLRRNSSWTNEVFYSLKQNKIYVGISNGFIEIDNDCNTDTFQIPKSPIEEKFEPALDFTVYPNPFSNIINIKISDKVFINSFDVLINNMEGKRLYKRSFHKNEKEISYNGKQLLPGIYFITIITSNEAQTKKIVKVD